MTSDNNYLKPKYAKYLLHDLMKICRSLNPAILMFQSMINCPSRAQASYHYRPQCSLWRRMIANLTATSVVTMILTIIHFLGAVWCGQLNTIELCVRFFLSFSLQWMMEKNARARTQRINQRQI